MITVFGAKHTQDDIDAVTGCLKDNWTGIGRNVDKFEQAFKARMNADNFLMVDSCSNALFLAIKALKLPPQSEIILPSFTWVACAQAVLMNDCIPVFADVDLLTQNITAKTIESHISDRTKAIMVVHYAGLPVDMQPILQLGFPVIEDAAHAVDAKVGDRYCGTLADIGCWSFDSVKNLAVGEGGGMWFKDKSLAEQSRYARYCGIGFSGFAASQNNKSRWWEYEIKEPNIKMLPTDIAGALGLAQLSNLRYNQQRRFAIWNYYQIEFRESNVTIPCDCLNNQQHGLFTYFIQVGKRRDALAKHLYSRGIYTTLRYHPLHLNKIFNCNYSLPVSEILNETGLNIPLHPNLTDNDVIYIVSEIKKFLV